MLTSINSSRGPGDTTMHTNRTTLRQVIAYISVAYTLALTIALALPHAGINLLMTMAVPTLTVAALTFTITPRGHRRALWSALGLKRAGLKAWPAALGLPVMLCAAAFGIALAVGAGRPKAGLDAVTPAWAVQVVTIFALTTVFTLGEEIGWRGYLLPRLQLLTGDKRRAAVLTGFIHGCFHLPLILLASTYDTGVPRWFAAPVVVAVVTAGGVFYAWLWDRSHSVWPVALAHNTVNTVFETGAAAVVTTSGSSLAYVAGETGVATLGVVALAAVVLLKKARVWRIERAQYESHIEVATTA